MDGLVETLNDYGSDVVVSPTDEELFEVEGQCEPKLPETGLDSTSVFHLPPEIITEIFLQCLDSGWDLTELTRARTNEAPLLLGRICSSWRNIALATPRLWAALGLTGRSIEHCRKDAQAATEFIRRSGTCPLSFSFWYYTRDVAVDDHWDRAVESVVEVILPHAWRWKHITMSNIPWEAVERIHASLASGVPLLESISIYVSLHRWPACRPRVVDLTSAVNMTSIQYSYPYAPFHFGSVLHNLREIEILWDSDADILTHLRQCPAIEVLNIQLYITLRDVPSVYRLRGGLELPHLKHLQLSTLGPPVCFLLNRLYLPSLMTLRVHTPICDKAPWPYISSLLHRSKSQLQLLDISQTPMTTHDLLDCLRQTPCLTSLRITTDAVTDEILTALTFHKSLSIGAPPLCPRLESIYFLKCYGISMEAMADMIISRWNPPNQNQHDGVDGELVQAIPTGLELLNETRSSPQNDTDLSRCLTLVGCNYLIVPRLRHNPTIAACVSEGLQILDYS